MILFGTLQSLSSDLQICGGEFRTWGGKGVALGSLGCPLFPFAVLFVSQEERVVLCISPRGVSSGGGGLSRAIHALERDASVFLLPRESSAYI